MSLTQYHTLADHAFANAHYILIISNLISTNLSILVSEHSQPPDCLVARLRHVIRVGWSDVPKKKKKNEIRSE